MPRHKSVVYDWLRPLLSLKVHIQLAIKQRELPQLQQVVELEGSEKMVREMHASADASDSEHIFKEIGER